MSRNKRNGSAERVNERRSWMMVRGEGYHFRLQKDENTMINKVMIDLQPYPKAARR